MAQKLITTKLGIRPHVNLKYAKCVLHKAGSRAKNHGLQPYLQGQANKEDPPGGLHIHVHIYALFRIRVCVQRRRRGSFSRRILWCSLSKWRWRICGRRVWTCSHVLLDLQDTLWDVQHTVACL